MSKLIKMYSIDFYTYYIRICGFVFFDEIRKIFTDSLSQHSQQLTVNSRQWTVNCQAYLLTQLKTFEL